MPEICGAYVGDYPDVSTNYWILLVQTLGEIANKCSVTLHIFCNDSIGY